MARYTPGSALWFLGATLLSGQHVFTSEQVAGSKLKHFAEVDKNIYKGSKPRSDADFRFLQSLHVKYIVDLEILPFMTGLEQRKANRYGITVIRGLMNASPISPSEKHVDFILATLRKDQPVYFHCKYGRDRTNVIAALYKMYFLGMTEPEAMRYVHDEGYKDSWVRAGLLRYIRKHPVQRESPEVR